MRPRRWDGDQCPGAGRVMGAHPQLSVNLLNLTFVVRKANTSNELYFTMCYYVPFTVIVRPVEH